MLTSSREQERPSSERAGFGARPVLRWQASRIVRGAVLDLLDMLGEVADLHAVPREELASGQLAAAGEGRDERGLAGAVGADEHDVLAALEVELRAVDSTLPGTSTRPSMSS